MKVIVAGSRTVSDLGRVAKAVNSSGFKVTEVVSGTARGADSLGETWAQQMGIPVRRFPANWALGKTAGFLRNQQMADYAEALVAVWDGQSAGTRDMIQRAQARGLQVYVEVV